MASASSPSAPAQPRKPEVFLAQAQTRPGGLNSTAEAGRSAVPRDHFSPVFVTEEFPFQHFRVMQAAAWPRGFSLELWRAGVDSRATRLKGEGRGALDIPPAWWGLLKQLLTKPHFLARLTVACPRGASVCGEGWVRRCRAGCLLTCVDPAGRSTPLLLPASHAPRLLSPPLLRVPPPLGKPTSVIKPFQHLLGAGGFAI